MPSSVGGRGRERGRARGVCKIVLDASVVQGLVKLGKGLSPDLEADTVDRGLAVKVLQRSGRRQTGTSEAAAAGVSCPPRLSGWSVQDAGAPGRALHLPAEGSGDLRHLLSLVALTSNVKDTRRQSPHLVGNVVPRLPAPGFEGHLEGLQWCDSRTQPPTRMEHLPPLPVRRLPEMRLSHVPLSVQGTLTEHLLCAR